MLGLAFGSHVPALSKNSKGEGRVLILLFDGVSRIRERKGRVLL